MSKLASLLALVGLACADSQFAPDPVYGMELGFCPVAPPTVGNNFDSARMEGHWYVVQVDKWGTAKAQDCLTFSIVDTENKLYPIWNFKTTYNYYDYENDAIISDPTIYQTFDADGSGRITPTWLPFAARIYSDNFDVLDTDYDNYAIIYSCNDVFFTYYREVMVLSRTPRISETYLEYI
jgi:hypothetical protein